MAERGANPFPEMGRQAPLRAEVAGGASLRAGLDGSQWILGSQILTSAANLVTTILLMRSIGLEAFGQFSLCFLLLMVVRNFFHGAVLAPTSTLAPRLMARSAAAFRSVLLRVTLGFAIGSSAILGVLVLLLAPLLQADWLWPLAVPLMLANIAGCFADLVSRYHLVHARPKRTFQTELLRYSVQMGVFAVLVVTGSEWLTPALALCVLAFGAVTAVLAGLVGYASLQSSPRFFRVLWPRYWNFVRWMSMANLVETVQTLSPMLIGLALLGEAALGVLRAVSQLANILNLPTNALQQILPTFGTKVYQNAGSRGLRRILTAVIGVVLLYFAAAGVVLFFLSPWIAEFMFGSAPAMFRSMLIWFVLANLFISVRLVAATTFVVRERPRHIFLIQGVSAVFAVILPLFAITIGAIAIPVAVAVSTGVGMLLCLWRAGRVLDHG